MEPAKKYTRDGTGDVWISNSQQIIRGRSHTEVKDARFQYMQRIYKMSERNSTGCFTGAYFPRLEPSNPLHAW
jgi:hypothetical protein